MAQVTTVANLPLADMLSWKRAGIIPYKIGPSGIEFVLGIDRATGELSNFAGSYKSSDVTIIKTAKREFDEETHGVFGRINDQQLKDSIAVCSSAADATDGENQESVDVGGELIIFYHYNYKKEEINERFAKKVRGTSEMKGLYFCDADTLIELLGGCTCVGVKRDQLVFYDRVRDLLIKAIESDGLFF